MEQELDRLKTECRDCQKCLLSKTRTNLVFSDGKANNKLMLIGEAPGFWEDQKGRPFVGKAGMLLDKILGCVNFSRKENIYITNTIKCRPENNRNPKEEEIKACEGILKRQIEILKPRLIILCGSIAMKTFLPNRFSITRERGKWFSGPFDSKMMPILHPSYLLRNDSRERGSAKWLTWQDIKEIRTEYDRL